MSVTKLTVGIPTFNRARWLRETIESVLAQTFTDFRLIVSDNASDDDTPEIVRSFNDGRIDYVRCELNIGRAGNFSRIIGLADTDFVTLVADDDILYPDHLEAAVDVLEAFETVGLAHSAFNLIDARSHVLRTMCPLASRSLVTIERRDIALERMMVSRWPMCFSSVVYRMTALLDAGGFREELEPFGDLHLWMRVALDWDFGYIAKPSAGFRLHAASASSNMAADQQGASDQRRLDLVQAHTRFERRMNFLEGAPSDPRRREKFRALATLQFLVDGAGLGLAWNAVIIRLGNLVRTYPRVVLRPTLWRLAMAQLGGRWLRSALGELRRHHLRQR